MRKFGRTLLRQYESFFYKKLLERNKELENSHRGESAYIFATGTSLVDTDLSIFKNKLTLGCNYLFNHPTFSEMNLDYYVVGVPYRSWRDTSPRFTNADYEKFMSTVNSQFSSTNTSLLLHATLEKYLKNREYLHNNSKFYFVHEHSANHVTNVDFTCPVALANGALDLMIALAIYMGCKKIYLHGCGYTYYPVQTFHFYDCMIIEQKKLTSEFNTELNNFAIAHPEADLNQFEYKIKHVYKDELLVDFYFYPEKIKSYIDTDFYRKYKYIKEYAETCGVQIVNVSPRGYASKIFESANN